MKTVLVFPPFFLESMYNLAPLGLINVGTALEGRSHQVALIDFVLAVRQGILRTGRDIYEDCAKRILEECPEVVGFSAQCTTYPAVLQIARNIREEDPGVKIVVGGHNASFLDRETLERYPFVDAVVRGEGEITFPELLDDYQAGGQGRGIPGVTCRDGDDILRNPERDLIPSLDVLPLPNYDLAPSLEEYRDACGLPRSIAILEVGRGCPHRCIYCSQSVMWRRRSRTFSVPRLINEMKSLSRGYGAECFLLAYDQFTASRKFVEEFCRAVITEGLSQLPWYCISRLDSVDPDLLGLMREAGCDSMCYGIDSGSERTLAFIHKNIDAGLLYRRVSETAEQGMIPTLSFVIGFPEEEKEDIDATLLMALRTGILGNNNPLIQLPTVLPGTELQHRYGSRVHREVDTYFALGLEFANGHRLDPDERMIDSDPVLFSSFYNMPCAAFPLDSLHLIAEYFPLMVRFYPRTFLLLALELGESISTVFLHWLDWLTERRGREEKTLSLDDCYDLFGRYLEERLTPNRSLKYSHIKDFLHYENIGVKVGARRSDQGGFSADKGLRGRMKPVVSNLVVTGEFDYDMPRIIDDLKNGEFRDRYPLKKTLLVFKQEGEALDVSQINPFVKDFLGLCDGTRTLEAISNALYHRHGEGKERDDFLSGCVEAFEELGGMGWIVCGEDR